MWRHYGGGNMGENNKEMTLRVELQVQGNNLKITKKKK